MKKFLLLLCGIFGFLIFSLSESFAQQKPVYSQYMFNHLAINPAYAGNQKQLVTTGLYRKQWVNFKGAPETITFSAHSAIPTYDMGLGLIIAQDKLGIHNNLDVYMSYAYQIHFQGGMLSMGLQAGFTHINADYTKLNLPPDITDPRFEGESLSSIAPNFGTGLFFSTDDMYIGVSVPMLIENQLKRETGPTLDQGKRFYFITAGKVFTLNERIKVKPSTLISYQQGNPVQVDSNVNFIFDDVLNAGISYRLNDALIFLGELQVNKNFRFGYSYDYGISDIRDFANGSHEIMLKYRFNLTREICHTYF